MKLISICLLFVNFSALASELQWYEGSVVLQGDRVLTGKFSIDIRHHLLLYLNNDNTTDVYPAHKIQRALYHDPQSNINRKYISIKTSGVMHEWRLFEVVTGGHFQIVRLAKFYESYSENPERDNYSYFVYQGRDLYMLTEFRQKVFPLLRSALPELMDFVRAENLNVNSLSDAVRMVRYYNMKQEERALLITLR